MTKIWKVTVNNWGWDNARTYYYKTRKEAQQMHDRMPAADPVEYAGLYTDANARKLLDDGDAYGWSD